MDSRLQLDATRPFLDGKNLIGCERDRTVALPMLAQPSVLWQLRGLSGTPVTCCIERGGSLCRLLVVMGREEVHRDTYLREADALGQAAFLYRNLIANGWTDVCRPDGVM